MYVKCIFFIYHLAVCRLNCKPVNEAQNCPTALIFVARLSKFEGPT